MESTGFFPRQWSGWLVDELLGREMFESDEGIDVSLEHANNVEAIVSIQGKYTSGGYAPSCSSVSHEMTSQSTF